MRTKLTLFGIVGVIGLSTALAGASNFNPALWTGLASLAVASTQAAGDCNGNEIADDVDIAEGTSQDCNQNGRPDECEFVAELTATGTALVDDEGPRGLVFSAFFYVHPTNASDRFVGQVAEFDLKDIAVDPTTGLIYTVDLPFTEALGGFPQHLYLVDPITGAGTQLPNPITPEGVSLWVLGLTFGPDGTLYGIGETGFVVIDKTTGAITETRNEEVFGIGMATSPSGQIYSIVPSFSQPPPGQEAGLLPGPVSVLQLHDSATGNVTSSVSVVMDPQDETMIVDIAFGADGLLYGIIGYVGGGSVTGLGYFYFEGIGLVIIDPVTGAWTEVGRFNGNLVGLGGPAGPAASDCNENSIPDECETDCNDNGIPDDCDLAAGAPDCNQNAIPDSCDIASGASQDCNQNAIPDECDPPLVLGDCPADVTVQATDAAGIVVEYTAPSAKNGCNPVVTVSPPSGTLFPSGTTAVTVTATDSTGATRSCTFQVTVLPPPEPGPGEQPEQPEPQPNPQPQGCVLFLFQSIFGIPLCGPCLVVGLLGTFVGMLGLRRRIRRWR